MKQKLFGSYTTSKSTDVGRNQQGIKYDQAIVSGSDALCSLMFDVG
jgi:hypothetical protein